MWLYFLVKWRLFLEQRKVRRQYYASGRFRDIDRALLKAYRFKNPFFISRKFLEKRGESDVHLYGETPLTTYDKIASECGLNKDDTVLELGCGRGRGVFFWVERFGAQVHGVEWIPEFVGKAKNIASQFSVDRATFSCEDFMQTNLNGYTVIYLFGTCLKEEEITRLTTRFATLHKAVRIVTVSYPLTELSPSFIVKKEFTASFPWGEAQLFIQSLQ